MHPHHNRDGEHVYTYEGEREVQYLKQQKGKAVTILLMDYMV